jgi:transposase
MGWEVSMGSTRRKFSREFKLEAVRMVTEGGYSAQQVARDLEIRPEMLRRWRRQFEEDPEQSFPGVGQRKVREEEMWRLRRDLERVTMERDILKNPLVRRRTSCSTRNSVLDKLSSSGEATVRLLVLC